MNKTLTKKQEAIIREQIRKNTRVIDALIYKVDLLMNKEGHKKNSKIVEKLRKKADLLMEENDTFRKVFWKHIQRSEQSWTDGTGSAYRYLLLKIEGRHKASTHNPAADYEIGTHQGSIASGVSL